MVTAKHQMVTVKHHLLEHRLKEQKSLISAGLEYPVERKKFFSLLTPKKYMKLL